MWAGQWGLSNTSLSSHGNLKTCEPSRQGIFSCWCNRVLQFTWEAMHNSLRVSCHRKLFSLWFELNMKIWPQYNRWPSCTVNSQVSSASAQLWHVELQAGGGGHGGTDGLIREFKWKREFMGDFLILSPLCKVTSFGVIHIWNCLCDCGLKNTLILQNVTRVGQPGEKPSRQ